MDGGGRAGGARYWRRPAWLEDWACRPWVVLLLLCVTSLVQFLDRGVVASNGVNGADMSGELSGLSGDFGLSLFQSGTLAALYFVGLTLAAPAAALLSNHIAASHLIAGGLALWCGTALGCGFAGSYGAIAALRLLVGAGNGPMIALAPALIDDAAPPARVAVLLGCFYLTMPLGTALGYLYGGAVSDSLSWRAAFWIEAGLGLPLALFFAVAAPLAVAQHAKAERHRAVRGTGCEAPQADEDPAAGEAAGKEADPPELAGGPGPAHSAWRHVGSAVAGAWRQLATLARQPVAVAAIGGLVLWNRLVGAWAWYGPKSVAAIFPQKDPDTVDFIFGAVIAIGGLVGGLGGGTVFDLLGSGSASSSDERGVVGGCGAGGSGRDAKPHRRFGSLCRGMLLNCGLMAGGTALAVGALAGAATPAAFWALFALGSIGVFGIQAPANSVLMWSVPAGLRPFALATSEALQHLFGDIPSPPALGATQDSLDNWRLSMSLFGLLGAASAVCFAAGAALAGAGRGRDYRGCSAVGDAAGKDAGARVAAAVGGGGNEELDEVELVG